MVTNLPVAPCQKLMSSGKAGVKTCLPGLRGLYCSRSAKNSIVSAPADGVNLSHLLTKGRSLPAFEHGVVSVVLCDTVRGLQLLAEVLKRIDQWHSSAFHPLQFHIGPGTPLNPFS